VRVRKIWQKWKRSKGESVKWVGKKRCVCVEMARNGKSDKEKGGKGRGEFY